MTRTKNSVDAMKPRGINLTTEVANLTDTIEGFGAPEITTTFIDAGDNIQKDYAKEYEDFVEMLEEISSNFESEAADTHLRVELLKAAAAAMNPLPHHKLRELDLIIEEIGQKSLLIQAKIASHYDNIIHTTRRLAVPATDKELFKGVAAFLQIEKSVKKSKVYKVLATIMKKAEEFWAERTKETEQQQPAPAQTTSTVKYKVAELTCNTLKFPPTPFELIEWKDNMWRWI